MKYIVNSRKDKNSLASRRCFGGVYINHGFYKDGTVLTSQDLKSLKVSEVLIERYFDCCKSRKKK